MAATKSVMTGSRISGRNREIWYRHLEFDVRWRRTEKTRGELEEAIWFSNVVLSMKVSRVNAGRSERCTRASAAKEIRGQSTV